MTPIPFKAKSVPPRELVVFAVRPNTPKRGVVELDLDDPKNGVTLVVEIDELFLRARGLSDLSPQQRVRIKGVHGNSDAELFGGGETVAEIILPLP